MRTHRAPQAHYTAVRMAAKQGAAAARDALEGLARWLGRGGGSGGRA